MHRWWAAQLHRTLGWADAAQVQATLARLSGVSAGLREQDPALAHTLGALETLFAQVDACYEQHDRQTTLLQRSLELTSEELLTANDLLRHELESRSRALETLQQALTGLLGVIGEQFPQDLESDIEQVAARLASLTAERERLHTDLQEGERRYRTLYDGVIDALLVCEIPAAGGLGKFIEVNEVACKRLGYTREELLTMSLCDINVSLCDINDASTPLRLANIADELRAGKSITVEELHVAKDGRCIPVEIHAHQFHILGRPAVLALARDITQRVHAEEQLRLWPKVFNASRDGILITDSKQRILSMNDAVSEITGYSEQEIIGQTPRIFASGRHDREFFRAMWAAVAGEGYWQGEVWDRRKSGEIYPKWLSISAVRNPSHEVTHYIGSFTDITERKTSEERIRFLAYHDVLTGLPNRLFLREYFESEISHARRTKSRLALLFLDLDRFKTINDSLGHPMGDKLLHAITQRLKSMLRETDIVSRQGGDEFVILLPDRNSVEGLPSLIQKLLHELNQPFEIEGHVLNVSSSIGISMYPDDGQDFDTLLKNADTALYQAKDGGRGIYRYFDEQMNAASLERMGIENRLRGAVDRGELALHYQLQVCMQTGRVAGVEALLRWTHPDLGAVAPCRFIPVAESSGLIVPIGNWILREACLQARAWHSAGLEGVVIAVNISAVQFRHGDLAETVARVLAETKADPACLELELTESIMIQDTESTLAAVQRVKGLGVRLSIDDFGTGYSSLSYLKRFAVDMLKIDQSFVRGLPNRDDAAIVRAIIQMAHGLNLSVIAEGVETEEQAEFLRAEGCDLAQGYLFGRPQPNPFAASEIAIASQATQHYRKVQ